MSAWFPQQPQELTDKYEYLNKVKRVAILVHMDPDDDAMASAVALKDILESIGKEVRIIANRRITSRRRIYHLKTITNLHQSWKDGEYVAIVVDTHTPKRLTANAKHIIKRACWCLVIDHHNEPDTEAFKALNGSCTFIVEPEAPSCAELVRGCMSWLLWHGQEVKISEEAATALATGIFWETDELKEAHKNTWEELSKLILHCGANMGRVYQTVEPLPIWRVSCAFKAINNAIIDKDRKLMILPTSYEEIKRTIPGYIHNYINWKRAPIFILSLLRHLKVAIWRPKINGYVLVYDSMNGEERSFQIVIDIIKWNEKRQEGMKGIGFSVCKKKQYRYYTCIKREDMDEFMDKVGKVLDTSERKKRIKMEEINGGGEGW